jgi:phosphohistidine phosphatase
MYRLFLMRHGEAGWAKNDLLRPLTAQGRIQATVSGNWMREKEYFPTTIYCSPSERTLETVAIVEKILGTAGNCGVKVVDSLYDSTISTIKNTLQSNFSSRSMLLIGHNPGLMDFLTWMCGVESDLHGGFFDFSTGSVCILVCSLENQAFTYGCAHIIDSINP